jgi:hypothetical protein
MKRILNLNKPGARILAIAALLIGLAPVLLYASNLIVKTFGIDAAVFSTLIWVFVTAGGLLLAALLVLIVAEQVQDHLIDNDYQRRRGQKLRVTGIYFECQYCGNRKVNANDRQCSVCGRELS